MSRYVDPTHQLVTEIVAVNLESRSRMRNLVAGSRFSSSTLHVTVNRSPSPPPLRLAGRGAVPEAVASSEVAVCGLSARTGSTSAPCEVDTWDTASGGHDPLGGFSSHGPTRSTYRVDELSCGESNGRVRSDEALQAWPSGRRPGGSRRSCRSSAVPARLVGGRGRAAGTACLQLSAACGARGSPGTRSTTSTKEILAAGDMSIKTPAQYRTRRPVRQPSWPALRRAGTTETGS